MGLSTGYAAMPACCCLLVQLGFELFANPSHPEELSCVCVFNTIPKQGCLLARRG